MCFFGGVCANLTISPQIIQETCICPLGYQHDFVLLHQNNCAVPSKLFLGLLIETSILSAFFFVITARTATRHKGKSRTLALQQCLQIVLSWLVTVGYYAQEGYFEAVACLSTLSLCFATYQIHYVLRATVLDPLLTAELTVSAEERKRILYGFAIVPILDAARIVVFNICLIVLARHPETRWFNIVMMINACSAPVFSVLNRVIIHPHYQKLLKLIDDSIKLSVEHSSNSARSVKMMKDFRARLVKSVRNMFASILVFMWFYIPVAIIYLVLGSVPFSWVFYVIMVHVTFLMTCNLNRVILSRKKLTRQDDDNTTMTNAGSPGGIGQL